jgi:hypothetical protein
MSHDISSLASTLAHGGVHFWGFDGKRLSRADISTLREALSIAEDRLKEKPQRGVRLLMRQDGLWLIYGAGIQKIGPEAFHLSSTETVSPSAPRP